MRYRTINELVLITVDGAHWQLAVARSSGAISSGKVVDNQTKDIAARDPFKRRLDSVDIGDGVTGFGLCQFQN